MSNLDHDYRIYRADGPVFQDVTIVLGDEATKQTLTLHAGVQCTVIVITDTAQLEKLWWKTGEAEP